MKRSQTEHSGFFAKLRNAVFAIFSHQPKERRKRNMDPIITKNEKGKSKNSLSIGIDPRQSCLDFYFIYGSDKGSIKHDKKQFTSTVMTEEFLAEIKTLLKDYASANIAATDATITLVLPDTFVAMDSLILPSMKKKHIDDALEATLSGFYKDSGDFTINHVLAVQNKQTNQFSLTVVNNAPLRQLAETFKAAGLEPNVITFAANATVNAINHLLPKTKTGSFLFIDAKHQYSRVIFSAKGRPTGFFILPFGYSVLRKNKIFSEDELFDHSVAELAVLNAEEKAKAKQLTGVVTDEMNEEEQMNAQFGEDEEATVDPTSGAAGDFKTTAKKKKALPKFMIRETPNSEVGYQFENFRLFMKWALLLLQENDKLKAQGEPEKVFINLPEEMGYLFEAANEEKADNGIEFQQLMLDLDNPTVSENLELFGGFYTSQFNKHNNFR